MKADRRRLILELIDKYEIETQDELRDRLEEAGFKATQATVSRDIKEMRLVKVLGKSGRQIYAASASQNTSGTHDKLLKVFAEAYVSVEAAMNMVVIKTLPGMAHAVASAIDTIDATDVVGTIAGDDCVFAVCRNEYMAMALTNKLKIRGERY